MKMNFQQLIQSIKNAHVLDIDGVRNIHLVDCFSNDELEFLDSVYNTPPEFIGLQWHMNKKEWPLDLDNTSDSYKELLSVVNQKLNTNFDHYVTRLWEEGVGHYMAPHTDNDMVCGSMQLYLPSTAAENTGTVFYGNGLTLQFKFQPNTGYACADPTRIEHSTGVPVSFNENRRSIYFIFRNL